MCATRTTFHLREWPLRDTRPLIGARSFFCNPRDDTRREPSGTNEPVGPALGTVYRPQGKKLTLAGTQPLELTGSPELWSAPWIRVASPGPLHTEWPTAPQAGGLPWPALSNWIVPACAVTALTFALLDDIIGTRKLAADVPVKRLRREPPA